MAQSAPDPARCKKAIKILEQFERLAKKFGVRLSPARLLHLTNRRNTGTIKDTDLPAKLRLVFPTEFSRLTLANIRKRCGMR